MAMLLNEMAAIFGPICPQVSPYSSAAHAHDFQRPVAGVSVYPLSHAAHR
jgi:hypothetical protein